MKEKDAPASLYKNEQAKQRAHESYDRAMKLWDTDYGEDWVGTAYGLTHIVTAGPPDAKPLFLMPGLFADATMWYANAGALADEYRVYAVDLPVFGGKSVPGETSIGNIQDYAGWFSELAEHYSIETTALAGLSYGSWLSLALARELPEHIAAVIMLDPSETFTKMRAAMAWKGFRYFVFFPNRQKHRAFFNWMGGGFSDPAADIWLEHMLDVIECGRVGMMDVPQHRVYRREELKMVTMPVLILAGGKPIIYRSPEKLKKAASYALPHAEIEIIPDTGHSVNVEQPHAVNKRILGFLKENYH